MEESNKQLSKENDISELRNHITRCLLDKLNHHRSVDSTYHRFLVQIKSWCLTLFMVSAGFCISRKKLDEIFYYLPLLPVVLFWLYHAYKQYLRDFYVNNEFLNNIDKFLSNLYTYSYNDLLERSDVLLTYKVSWENKGRNNLHRLISKKIPGILKKGYSLENLMFFFPMLLFWVIVIIFKY